MTGLLLVGAAAGVAALAIARGEVAAFFRAWVAGRSLWFGELVSCPLCLGFWFSLGFTALQGVPSGIHPVVAWGASWAAGAAVAGLLERLYERPA